MKKRAPTALAKLEGLYPVRLNPAVMSAWSSRPHLDITLDRFWNLHRGHQRSRSTTLVSMAAPVAAANRTSLDRSGGIVNG